MIIPRNAESFILKNGGLIYVRFKVVEPWTESALIEISGSLSMNFTGR